MTTDAQTTLLAIETSCDETGVAVLRQRGERITVLAEGLASQMDIHAATGGVVPDVAAREHAAVIRPLLERVLSRSGCRSDDLDAVAVTVGPGLEPALTVGIAAAQTLSFAWSKPLVPVNHLEGHIYSALLAQSGNSKFEIRNSSVVASSPALALIVSGGHTLLVLVRDHLQYEVLGQTRDDAAGEAFDKVARLLGLSYPGGAALSQLAGAGNPEAYAFPRPMRASGDLDMSFAGLKTAVYYTWRDLGEAERGSQRAHIAASFQAAVVDTLAMKTEAAIALTQPRLVLLAGGVAANEPLRAALVTVSEKHAVPLQVAPLWLCGDNAVMIGLAGLMAYAHGRVRPWRDVDAVARLRLGEV